MIMMGIITGELLYLSQLAYNAARNNISYLDGAALLEGLVFRPSAAIFDTVMILGGILILLGWVRLERNSRKGIRICLSEYRSLSLSLC
jgi:hypothetical protein